ncbi:MAG TPA: hypothetical protein VGF22_24125 [Acidimicrobiales bacterium]|jgi:hypothetical protein
MADAPETVSEAVAMLEAEGYTSPFVHSGGELVCGTCGACSPLDPVVVDRFFRFEGPSDPADEAIVLGVHCSVCGARGTIVSAFGPNADPDEFDHVARISAEAAAWPSGRREERPGT